MRGLLGDSSGADASKYVGIALGVAGGVIIITGILLCLYRRYAGLSGSLAGIPPERKTLVFTDLRKVQDVQRSQLPYAPRFSGARAPSRVVLPVTFAAAMAQAADSVAAPPTPRSVPSPRASSRPTSAMRASGSLLPALSVGLEAGPLPSTPGSIASPRGHGRVLFSTMDHPRSSNAGPAAAAVAIGANTDDSRAASSSTPQPQRTSGFHGGGGGSRSGTIDGSGITAAVGERPGSGGLAPSRHSSSGSAAPRARGSVGAAAAAGPNALPPALVPTGSVITAWKSPLAVVAPEPGPERSLNSLAAGTTTSPVETFNSAAAAGGGSGARPKVVSVSGIGADGTLGRLPPPYRGSTSGTSGPVLAAVAAAAAGSLGTPAGAAGFTNVRQCASRSRPGSGSYPSAAASDSGAAVGTGTGTAGPTATDLQRLGVTHRSPRTSYGAGISLGTTGQAADDPISSISASSSNFHSSSHAGEDSGAPHHHQQQQQRQLQLQRQQLDSQQSISGGVPAASAAGGYLQASAVVFQRSRLGPGAADANASFTSSQSSAAGAMPPAGPTGCGKWDALIGGAGTPPPRISHPSYSPATVSVGVTVAAAAVAEPLKDSTATAAAATAVPREITEMESVGEGGSRTTMELPEPATVAVTGDGGAGDGSSGSNGASEAAPASRPSAGDASPPHTPHTQSAWDAAVSLSSKLFGRGSRAGTAKTSPKHQLQA